MILIGIAHPACSQNYQSLFPLLMFRHYSKVFFNSDDIMKMVSVSDPSKASSTDNIQEDFTRKVLHA